MKIGILSFMAVLVMVWSAVDVGDSPAQSASEKPTANEDMHNHQGGGSNGAYEISMLAQTK
jgi:hypothetical protein